MNEKRLEGINLSRLQALSLVRETGNISGAAGKLFVTPQAVTMQIKALEKALGAQLLEKEGRGVLLTPAGRLVEATGRDMLSQLANMRHRIADIQRGVIGSVSLGAHSLIGNYFLPPLLPRFISEHPGIKLELRGLSVGELSESILNGDVELAYFLGVFDAGEFRVTPVGFERMFLVASPDHPLANESAITIDRLAGFAFVAPHGSSAWKPMLEQELLQLGMTRRNTVVELGSIEGMREAAVQGVGMTVLFESAITEVLDKGLLRVLPLRGFAPRVPIYRLQHPSLTPTAAAQELSAYLDREIPRNL